MATSRDEFMTGYDLERACCPFSDRGEGIHVDNKAVVEEPRLVTRSHSVSLVSPHIRGLVVCPPEVQSKAETAERENEGFLFLSILLSSVSRKDFSPLSLSSRRLWCTRV